MANNPISGHTCNTYDRICEYPFNSGYATTARNSDWAGFDVTSAGWGATKTVEACAEFTFRQGLWFFTHDSRYNNCYAKSPKYDPSKNMALYAHDDKVTPWVLPNYDFPGSFDPYSSGVIAESVEYCRHLCTVNKRCMAFNYEPETWGGCYLKVPDVGRYGGLTAGVITRLK
ncbi:hypothetical protein BDR26DRAFT_862629 [Obelidium mucronatum]|nr:hypothetical protein BDR26DRAFT_862629 [Obelidium mucronatum]